ncbi:GNAT family N-acetyltransferase [Lichenibacterium dinghuense]|uniref:GNAT family N-acetyltransferase n=1 Tax=Lichenibacterium dinghuense TaxID=2895977 RepID=UPI001F253C1C|nr:GNAT family N-acetyltransferase [Lichenibacterium sp. 6Y81]
MTGSGLALRAERACYAVWPALREETVDGWLLRFSGGHTNRANSVNVAAPAMGDLAGRIAACEALYRAEGLPTVFRLSTALPEPGLEEALDAAGYGAPFDSSLVLHADFAASPPRPVGGASLREGRPDARWLDASAALAGLDATAAALRARMLDRIAAPAAFASVEVDGAVAAQACGAVAGGLVCLNAVATAPEHRGRGLAGHAVAAVLRWAAEREGATGACLQMLDDNPPALALYRRLGFTAELSRYHYRRAPAPAANA